MSFRIYAMLFLGFNLSSLSAEAQRNSEEAARVKAGIAKAPSSRVLEITRTPSREGPRPDVTSAVVATPVADSQTLRPGQARIKSLPPALERQSRAVIVENVPEVQNAEQSGKSVAVLNGAVELLSKDRQELTLKALAFVNEPMRFNGQRMLYEGSISVGVVELMPSGRSLDLSAPITFEILGVAAKPSQPAAEKTAPPFQTVAIEANNPNGSVNVRVRSLLNPNEESVVALPVERLRLRASVSPETIQGWGLEKSTLTVWAEQLSASGSSVQLGSRLGRVQPQTIVLDNNARGSSEVRSVSFGRDTLIAEGLNFDPVTKEIDYVLPIRFILAALVGGLLGGIPGSQRRWQKIVSSLIYGIIVFALFAVGVNVTGFAFPQFAGEVLVFVVSAVGALFGQSLLPKPKGP